MPNRTMDLPYLLRSFRILVIAHNRRGQTVNRPSIACNAGETAMSSGQACARVTLASSTANTTMSLRAGERRP